LHFAFDRAERGNVFTHYRTQGLIIGKEDRGEADQLFIIYTKDFGKLEILGKAIKKISSKLRSGADIFYLSEIEFIQGKTYKTLIDAILIEKFEILRKSLKRLKIAYQVANVLDTLVRGQEKDEKIWVLLQGTFKELNNWKLKIGTLKLIYYYFFWNFFALLGYKPELYNCVLCQKKLIPESLYFNSKEGGVICDSCFKKSGEGEKISQDLVKILRVILKKNWVIFQKLKIENFYKQALKNISEGYFSFICSMEGFER